MGVPINLGIIGLGAMGSEMLSVAAVHPDVRVALGAEVNPEQLERALKSGEVGDVCGVEIRLAFPKWPREFQSEAVWLASRRQGGFIREVFSHFAYVTDRLIGSLKPAFVQLVRSRGSIDGSESSAFGLLHAGHIPVSVVGQTNAAAPEMYEWYIYGTQRSYCLRDWGDLFISRGKSWDKVALDGESGSEMIRLTTFSKQIRGEKLDNRLPDFSVGLRVLKPVDAFHDSFSTANTKTISFAQKAKTFKPR
jgi:predicted dehydrogenase